MAQLQKAPWSDWETVRLIGSGSFGTVYEIQRKLVDEETESAALKVITIPQNPSDVEELYSEGYDDETITATFQSHLKSIVAEYSLMRKMDGSANVVNCKDIRYIQHDDGIGWDIYIRMELLTPLMKALPLDVHESTVVKIAKDMCNALVLCKKHEIVHRDIKPQNIFVSANGDYKLGDFGIAKTVEKTMGGTKIGTYKYMAPEVYNNQPYGSAADIYSLGLVLYWLLNERRMPFMPLPPAKLGAGMDEESRRRRLSGEKIPEPAHGSPELKQIVLKACAYDPRDRYESAAAMLEDLEKLAIGPVTPLGTVLLDEQMLAEQDKDKTVSLVFHKMITPEEEDVTVKVAAVEKVAEDAEISAEAKDALAAQIGAITQAQTEAAVEAAATAEAEPIVYVPRIDASFFEPEKEDYRDTIASKYVNPRRKGNWQKYVIIGLAVFLALVLVGLLKFCSGPKPVEEPEGTETTSTQSSVAPGQADWSGWTEKLPAGITADKYEIEKKTLYSSRELKTTSSTEKNTMAGWELFDTVKANGEFGPWSDWSATKMEASGTKEVQTQTQYRFRDKETTTSVSSTMDGWTVYDTSDSWGEYGQWSKWSAEEAVESESRKVERKTQYRYRDITYTSGYSDWSEWSAWSFERQSTDEFKKEESRTVWGYYYYTCSNCGAHMHGWNIYCPTWAGGCGVGWIGQYDFTEVYSTTSWDEAGLKDWHGTGKAYAYIDGEVVFKWTDGGSGTQYRYATRTMEQSADANRWSDWSDTEYTETSNRQVETRTLYRYCDRSSVLTYHFYRWGGWSNWSEEKATASDDRQVEESTFYRYREQVKRTTYYFRKWTDWSAYAENVVTPSDTVEVRTKEQYRYKVKAS